MANILAQLNSHRAGIIGVLTFIVGLATDPTVNGIIHLLPSANASEVQQVISKAAEISGLILAYFGKPKTVA